jgi:hypothetical protein
MTMVEATHVTDAEIDQFRRRHLRGSAFVAFGDHLAACAECRSRLAARGDAATASAALQDALGLEADDHVPEDEIRAFVEGDLDKERRAGISAHLAVCASCAAEVRDLSDFAGAFHRSSRPASPWLYGTFAAAAVLLLSIGAAILWRGNGPAPSDAAVRDALASGRLALPSLLSDLTGPQGSRLGEPEAAAFHLTAPIATVVLDTRPMLRWTALPGSPTYVVTLQEQSTSETITSPPLQGTAWSPEPALARGRVYAWQVAASAGGQESIAPRPPDPPARFMIADAAAAARLERLPASPLARGVAYANAGALDDAEREFRTIGVDQPGADRVPAFLAQLKQARAPR